VTAQVPYRIEVSGEARRGLHRLPAKVAAAIIEFVTGPVADNPARLSKPLTNELDAYRSARRGDYRVLSRIDEPAHVVLVVRIDHRADIYRT
jgi:mRNA interferase RelE/StbE